MFHELKRKKDRKFAKNDLYERKIMWLRMMGGGGCASKEMQSSQTIAMEIGDSWQILQTLKVNCAFLAKFPI